MLAVGADIAGDEMPVALGRNHRRLVLAAVEIADQPADAGNMRGDGVLARQPFGDSVHADIHGDMLVEQRGIDAEIDVSGDEIGGMIGEAQQPVRARLPELAVGPAVDQRSFPLICHHSRWAEAMLWAAAMQASSLS